MKPVDQTRTNVSDRDLPPANCFQACIASILELSIEKVPDEKDFWSPGMHPWDSWKPYYKNLQVWLTTFFGVFLLESANYTGSEEPPLAPFCIISGPSPRSPESLFHAAVGLGHSVIHDPHPSRDGLTEPLSKWQWAFFVSLNPKK